MNTELVTKVARGVAVSAGTTLLSAGVLVVLAVGLGVAAGTANVVAVLCGIGPSYAWNRRFVWRRAGASSISREVAPFWALSLTGLAVSTVAVERMARWSHAWPSAARAVALPFANLGVFGALWVVQFVLCDRVIFHRGALTS
ncbi:MAG TPA: GtrA family protein [Acidimicrobiia bacterium]|jgi:putative flippase GtrA|nr:GtrA family protein [Acidimicrobiia bacterium]